MIDPMRRMISRGEFIATSIGAAACGVGCTAVASATARPAIPATIRVKLFSGMELASLDVGGSVPLTISVGNNSVTLAAASYDAQTNMLVGASTTVRPGSAAITITSMAPIAVSAVGATPIPTRHYNGKLVLQRVGSSLLAVNVVDVESYIASTLASEMSPGWAAESLRAQAIVSRTYAVRAAARSAARPYDVTDDTSNQVYRGLDGVAPSFVGAASTTAGMVVLANNEPADVYYSSACGGFTADSIELTGHAGPAYLNGVPDTNPNGQPYCARAPYYAWENTVQPEPMARVLDMTSGDIADLEVKDRWRDGRVKTMRVVRMGASALDLDGRQFYLRCSSQLGYKVLPSAMFEVERSEYGFTFKGHGLGHGVGMCQWGARGRADAGVTAKEILSAYFPGTSVSGA